jgi:CheY-like chemotaxis protein
VSTAQTISARRYRRIPRDCLIRFLRENGLPLGPLADGVPVLLVAVPAADGERVKVACGDGFTWATAADGFAAGVAALESPPAAVVIDLALGRSEAAVIAGRLRALPGTAGAVLVALAGEDGADEAGLLAAGFDAVIHRPFHPTAVAERLLPLAG